MEAIPPHTRQFALVIDILQLHSNIATQPSTNFNSLTSPSEEIQLHYP